MKKTRKFSEYEVIELLKEQIDKCADKAYDLLCTDDDAETWHEKIKETDLLDLDEY